jgi:hypothetical protein
MTINEFIEKYKTENITIEYWNNLIKIYKIDSLNFNSFDLFVMRFNPELYEMNNSLEGNFEGFCRRQIRIIEVENEYKPQQNEFAKDKPIKLKKEFNSFFKADTKPEIIEKIQINFKNNIGKKMAYLIYLLETDLKIITYSLNGKDDSRKHFVESLVNKTVSMQGINKCFVSHAYELDIKKFEKDNDYVTTKEKLLKTIE